MQTQRNSTRDDHVGSPDVSRRTLLKTAGMATAGATSSLAGVAAASDEIPDGTPRIWPIRTDASGGTCSNAAGTKVSATGEGSARWFDYGGCGTWKVFPVVAGEQYYIRASTDRSLLTDLSYHVQEPDGDGWVTREEHVYGHRRDAEVLDVYTPSAGVEEIRIEKVDGGRGNGFYVSVYGPERSSWDPARAFEEARDEKLALAARVDDNAFGALDDRGLVEPVLDRLIDTAGDRPIEETEEAIRRMTLAETVTDTVLAGAGPGDSPHVDGDHDLSKRTAEYALNPIVDLLFVNLSIRRIAKRFRTVRRTMERASRAIGNFVADVLAYLNPGLSRYVRRHATDLGDVILGRVISETEAQGKELAAEEFDRIRSEETVLFVEDGSRRIFEDALFDPDYEYDGHDAVPLSDSLEGLVETLDAEGDGPTFDGSDADATVAAERRRQAINDAIDATDEALESDVVAEVLRTSGLLATTLGTIAIVVGVTSANPAVAVIGFASTLLGIAPTVLVSAAAWGTGFVNIVGLRYFHQLALEEILLGEPMEGA